MVAIRAVEQAATEQAAAGAAQTVFGHVAES